LGKSVHLKYPAKKYISDFGLPPDAITKIILKQTNRLSYHLGTISIGRKLTLKLREDVTSHPQNTKKFTDQTKKQLRRTASWVYQLKHCVRFLIKYSIKLHWVLKFNFQLQPLLKSQRNVNSSFELVNCNKKYNRRLLFAGVNYDLTQWFSTFYAATHFATQFNLTTPFRKFPVRHIKCSCVGKIEYYND